MIRSLVNISFIFLLLVGCSNDDDQVGNNGHVWKTQTDSLEKAKAVEDMLQDDAEDKSRKIEDAFQN